MLLGVISAQSLTSTYVAFELGARWGTQKTLIPLLTRGTPNSVLEGPLVGITALRLDVEAQVHQLLNDLGKYLGRSVESAAVYNGDLRLLVDEGPWESVTETAVLGGVTESDDSVAFSVGRLSHYSATEPDGDTCVLSDCRVLVCRSSLTDLKQLLPILEQVARERAPLLIVAGSVQGEVLSTLITNTRRGAVQTCLVCTGFGADGIKIQRLIAKRTASLVFEDEAGRAVESAKLQELGRAVRVESSAVRTSIVLRR